MANKAPQPSPVRLLTGLEFGFVSAQVLTGSVKLKPRCFQIGAIGTTASSSAHKPLLKPSSTAKLILTISLVAFAAAIVAVILAPGRQPGPKPVTPASTSGPSIPSVPNDSLSIPTSRIVVEKLAAGPAVEEPVVAPPSEQGGAVALPVVATEPSSAPVPSPEPAMPVEVDHTPKIRHVHPELYRAGCDGFFLYSQETSAGGTVVIGSVKALYTTSTYPTGNGFGVRVSVFSEQD